MQHPKPPAGLAAALASVRDLLDAYATVEPLTAARLATELDRYAKDVQYQAVCTARLRRAGWDSIGEAVGWSPQAASEQFTQRD